MYFDWTYVFIMLPMLLLSLLAQYNVKSTYSKYSKQINTPRMTGREAAKLVLEQHGVYNVSIMSVPGELTDHFDPRSNVIRLSESVYNGNTVAAIGVAAHEAGHAVQYSEGYVPMKIRGTIIPVTQIGSNLAFPLVLIGLVLSFYPLAYVGIALFGFVVVFQLVTLPVEYNASRRALESLQSSGSFSPADIGGASAVLRAAAMTYLAALAVALANLLRLVFIVGRRRR